MLNESTDIKNARGIIFCYSTTSQRSLSEITDHINTAERIRDRDPQVEPYVLVGTKIDLEDQREVCE